MKYQLEQRLDSIVSRFDYSNIQAYKVSDRDCENLALKAKEYGFHTVVVGPSSLPIVDRLLKWSGINIAVSIAYPSGAYFPYSKREEIDGVLETGYRVDELYMVMAVGRFLSGYEVEIRDEMKMFAEAARGRTTKLVIEAGVMSREQKKRVCDLAAEAGIKYVVTSTGFLPYEVPLPTADDIKELVEAAAGRVGIVACGEINNKDQALEVLKAGADRICTMEADRIVDALKAID